MSRVELSLAVVSPAVMRRLNQRYRGKDKTTDVLSFPLLRREELSTRSKKHGILHLGDIFVNREDAKKDFFFLVAHGLLHLLGFDHEKSPREEKIMFALQDEIINYLRNRRWQLRDKNNHSRRERVSSRTPHRRRR